MPPANSTSEIEPGGVDEYAKKTEPSLLERAFPGMSDQEEALDLELMAARRRARSANPRITQAELYIVERRVIDRQSRQ